MLRTARTNQTGPTNRTLSTAAHRPHASSVAVGRVRLFCFCIFQKKILQKYIFGFRFYSSIPLPPGRGAAGGLPPGRWAVGTYM